MAAAAAIAAGCGAEETLTVVEGEPVEVGELSYNVQLTRQLNRHDRQDAAYLRGQPRPAADQMYLGVFMIVENHGDTTAQVPREFEIEDTRGNSYRPVESDSVFALELGREVPPGESLPPPDSPAASGPIRGSLVLFRVERTVSDNRPLELRIPGPGGEDGLVELDI